MLAAVTTGVNRIELMDLEDPVPGPGQAVVAVEAVGLCGSDIHILDGSHFSFQHPVVQGHEAIGRVLQLPDAASTALRPGDRVAIEPLLRCGVCYPCRRGLPSCCTHLVVQGVHVDGALRERTVVDVDKLHPIGQLPTRAAVLVEPVTIAIHGLERVGGVSPDEVVLVLGAGPIGLVTAVACLDRGARVVVADRDPGRLALARRLGVHGVADTRSTEVASWVRGLTAGEGPGLVVEAAGAPELLRTAIEVVAASGTVLVLGMSDQEVSVPLSWFTRKEVTVVGSRTSVAGFPEAIALVERHQALIAQLVTDVVPLRTVGQAFDRAMTRPEQVCKVVVLVGEEVAS